MSALYTSPVPARRKPPQRAETTTNSRRISESARGLALHLIDVAPQWPAEGSVLAALESRHVRGIRAEDLSRLLYEDRREWRQRAMALVGHIQAGVQEFARIPMDNRQEREEVA